MASSSSKKKEIKEAKKRLVDLQEEVEEFNDRLRQQIGQTNQSIDKLSNDFESKCRKIWQEFDFLVENARLKAAELCDEMKVKTQEQQGKWRRTLRGNERLLEETGKWMNDLRQLFGSGNDDDVRRLETEGSELTLRLRQSSAIVGEGQLVMTFPDWCRRALSDLQNEVVDFDSRTSRTWPPRDLELRTEYGLQDSNLGIESIAVSDEDGHVFVVDGGIGGSIKEFSESGEFIGQCPFGEEGQGFWPCDICRLPEDRFVVCGGSGLGGRILFLTRQKSQPFLKKEKIIDTKEKPFSSLCQMKEEIFVSVWDFEEILCYSKEGMKLKSIKIGGWPGSGGRPPCPRLRADPTTGNLWLTGFRMTECFVFDQEGQILQKLETEKEISDFCSDDFGHFYFCDRKGIFSILPEKVQNEFPEESEDYPKIFVSQGKLFLSFQKD